MMKKLILLFIIFLRTACLGAVEFDIRHYTNSDGLSNSSVNTIFQDRSGRMWFGTWDGLNRFNGRSFRIYKPEFSDISSPSSNIIREIIETTDGMIWIATERGVDRYDPRTEEFRRYFSGAIEASLQEHPFSLSLDTGGNVCVFFSGRGLFRFSQSTNDFISLASVPLNASEFIVDRNDNAWILSSDSSVYKIPLDSPAYYKLVENAGVAAAIFYDENYMWVQNGNKYRKLNLLSEVSVETYSLPRDMERINSVSFFEDGSQILGVNSGLYRMEPGGKTFNPIMKDIPVTSLYYGSQDIIWVGTDTKGIFRLAPEVSFFHSFPEDGGNFFGGAVRCFAEDREGNFFVGTKGNGLFVFRREGAYIRPVSHITEAQGLINNSVFAFYEDSRVMWIGTDGRGLNYYEFSGKKLMTLRMPDGINLEHVYSIVPDDADVLWVGTSGQGLFRLEIDRSRAPYSVKSYSQFIYREGENSISNNVVYSILKDESGSLWIGTRGGGLNRLNLHTMEFSTVNLSSYDEMSNLKADVTCLSMAKGGTLMVGTSSGYYMVERDRGDAVVHLGESDGMPNSTVHGIIMDRHGRIWLSTNRGLVWVRQNGDAASIVPFFKEDGLQDNEFSDGAFYTTRGDGLLAFGGIGGLTLFNPEKALATSYLPEVLFESFFIDNTFVKISDYKKDIKGVSTLLLPYKNNSFGFTFVPADYISSLKCDISYMLEGYMKDWVNIGSSSSVVFSRIPAGNYKLIVRSSSADGIHSDHYYSMPVKISQPWYAGTLARWIYLVLFLIISFGMYRGVKYRLGVRRQVVADRMEKARVEYVHEAKLQFFVNIAHEFSNSLSLIYGPCEELLSESGISAKERRYLDIIKSNSERMRNLIQQLINFRKAETGHLDIKYSIVDVGRLVNMEASLFGDAIEQKKISFKIVLEPEKILWTSDRDCLEKIIFNLISNAIKYTPAGEEIRLSAKIDGENKFIIIDISNTGVGIPEEKLESIFDRYTVLEKFEQDISKGKTSNGIGLAMCKSLCELLGGNISVESDSKSYTSFIVQLPYRDGVVEQEEMPAEPGQKPEIQTESMQERLPENPILGRNVLIVDDDDKLRAFLSDILYGKYSSTIASNGKMALEKIRENAPDAIISDVVMPEMNGIQLLAEVKKDPVLARIPFILLSAENSVEEQINGIQGGADAYLGKPFNPSYLLATLDNLIGRAKSLIDYGNSTYSALDSMLGRNIAKEDKQLVYKITSAIRENLDTDTLSIDYIAQECGLSRMQLYRKTKDLLNMSPIEYVQEIRLDYATKLLKSTNKTIQEIVYQCGFNNKTYFYKSFSKKYGMTPKAYREGRTRE